MPKAKAHKTLTALFKHDQKHYGTTVAIHNLVTVLCTDLLDKVGVIGMKLKHKPEGTKKRSGSRRSEAKD